MKQIFATVVAFLFFGIISTQCQDINYFGVGYSPYVRSDGVYWNSYTLDEIKQMLRIVLTNHNSISSYSMGVSGQLYLGKMSEFIISRICNL